MRCRPSAANSTASSTTTKSNWRPARPHHPRRRLADRLGNRTHPRRRGPGTSKNPGPTRPTGTITGTDARLPAIRRRHHRDPHRRHPRLDRRPRLRALAVRPHPLPPRSRLRLRAFRRRRRRRTWQTRARRQAGPDRPPDRPRRSRAHRPALRHHRPVSKPKTCSAAPPPPPRWKCPSASPPSATRANAPNLI